MRKTMSVIVLILFVTECSTHKVDELRVERPRMRSMEVPRFIGNATMLADRSIEVCYFIEVNACKTYRPDDPHYENVLRHSNGLTVGDSRGLSPFEDGE